MAYENIEIQYPNFCLTPQQDVIATVDTSVATTIVRFKNTGGGLVVDYTLSSNIPPANELLAIEYVGPLNLGDFEDGLTFFTLEKENSTTCHIKRWEMDTGINQLELKQTITKTTAAGIYYDALGFAVEHYKRSFDFNQPAGQIYLEINSTSRLQAGDILLLGPSTDADNIGAFENVTVDHISGNKVYLTAVSGTQYDYVDGDEINFFNNIYLISNRGYLGDARYGNIIKLGAYSGTVKEYTTAGEYKKITGARWHTGSSSIASIMTSQLVFIRPYDSYLNWRSMFLNNIEGANKNYFEIYDVVFDENTIYKLALKTIRKDDNGNVTTITWTNYNFQQDSFLPYTQNVTIYMDKQTIVGPGSANIYVQVRDQFGVGLLDVNVNLYADDINAHPGFTFDPLNGQAITDSNGEAIIGYNYTPPTDEDDAPSTILVRADKSSVASTGSFYCWNELIIYSENKSNITLDEGDVRQIFTNGLSDINEGRLKQLVTPFKIERYERTGNDLVITVPDYYLICLSNFGTPGGDWVDGNSYDPVRMPWFRKTPPRTDGPADFGGPTWDCIGYDPPAGEPIGTHCIQNYSLKAHFIKQLLEFTQFGVPHDYYLRDDPKPELNKNTSRPLRLPQPKWYWSYEEVAGQGQDLEDGAPISNKLFQYKEILSNLQISQLKLSRHTHYVDGDPYRYLFTNVSLDQFIFVEDADPAFFSYKNPIETDIWIRLRPFAYNLDGATLKFYIREVWTEGVNTYDTGYYDVAGDGTITYFDAGGGLQGIEFLYDPPVDFHYNSIVYVHIEVYDEADDPNYIYTDYWFTLIPDYNAPYLENLSPDREEDQVNTNTNLYFEIKDDGAGVDISTLEVYLNSRIIYHNSYAETHPELNLNTTITEINIHHYTVSIDIPYDLYYDKEYTVRVFVSDISPDVNTLNDSYRFYTRASNAPIFVGFDPALCKRGLPRFTDVSFIVLANGNGVDRETIRLQVHDRDVTNQTTSLPIIYRADNFIYTSPISLDISNFSLGPYEYTSTSGSICVDITDDIYNVVTSGTYFVIDGATVSGITFDPITDGYRMCYDPVDEFESFVGPTEIIIHTENDNSDALEMSFYITSGYTVGFKHRTNPYDYDKQVVVRAAAENLASCPRLGTDAYWFTTVPKISKDLGATINAVPWSTNNLGAEITPTTDTIYFYGKTFKVEIRAKDLAGNVMEPYIFEFKIEDKP